MAVKEGNMRLIITLSDDIRCKLHYSCEKEMRNKSKQVEYILQYYFDNVIEDIFKTNEFSYYKGQVFDKERKSKQKD